MHIPPRTAFYTFEPGPASANIPVDCSLLAKDMYGRNVLGSGVRIAFTRIDAPVAFQPQGTLTAWDAIAGGYSPGTLHFESRSMRTISSPRNPNRYSWEFSREGEDRTYMLYYWPNTQPGTVGTLQLNLIRGSGLAAQAITVGSCFIYNNIQIPNETAAVLTNIEWEDITVIWGAAMQVHGSFAANA
ncbi:hypothetical protein B0H11DRAFT_2233829 [Mycena galericulata]|nr:hypothetical protein B0H11DRAFT_2233829 [Mycena galericulata]